MPTSGRDEHGPMTAQVPSGTEPLDHAIDDRAATEDPRNRGPVLETHHPILSVDRELNFRIHAHSRFAQPLDDRPRIAHLT